MESKKTIKKVEKAVEKKAIKSALKKVRKEYDHRKVRVADPYRERKNLSGIKKRVKKQKRDASHIGVYDTVGNQAASMERILANVSPEALFAASCARPGFLDVPITQYENQILQMNSGIIRGRKFVTVTAEQAAQYTLITLSPTYAMSAGAVPIRDGIAVVPALLPNATITQDQLRGGNFTDTYGNTVGLEKQVVYGTTLQVVIHAPSANIAGEMYLGCLPADTFDTSNITSLLDYSDTQIDLKKQTQIDIKSFISNRQLFHSNMQGQVDVRETWEEPVAYIIVPPRPAVNITTGEASAYTIELKPKSNMAWLPSSNAPIMASICKKRAATVCASTRAMTEFAQAVTNSIYSWRPWTETRVLTELNQLLKHPASAAKHIKQLSASQVVRNPVPRRNQINGYTLPSLAPVISDLQFFYSYCQETWSDYPPPIDYDIADWFANLTAFIAQFESYNNRITAWNTYLQECSRKIVQDRDKTIVKYYDKSGEEVPTERALVAIQNADFKTQEKPTSERKVALGSSSVLSRERADYRRDLRSLIEEVSNESFKKF